VTEQVLSSAYIAEQQSAATETLVELETRAEKLAFAAVGGDDAAVSALADLNAQIERAKADVVVFQRAKATADRREAEARHAAGVASRAAHRVEAGRLAHEFVALVDEADAAVSTFLDLLKRVGMAEAELRREVRAAGISTDSAVIGRSGASIFLSDRIRIATSPDASFRDNPPVAPLTRRAWDFLLRDKGGVDV
jgi:hypothetical protein